MDMAVIDASPDDTIEKDVRDVISSSEMGVCSRLGGSCLPGREAWSFVLIMRLTIYLMRHKRAKG